MISKAELRRDARLTRQRLADSRHGALLAAQADALALVPGAVVAGYAAFRDEADPRDLMAVFATRGHPLAMPAIVERGAPLRFHLWCAGDAMVVHPYGVREPLPDCPQAVPDVLLVPLLAFDAAGYRLGYGGGYYDRTLAVLRAARPVRAIGIAYTGQQVDALPHGPHDQRLDAVLTEAGLVHFSK